MARILVVEDSPDVRALLRVLLEAADHEVFTASDGQEGVEATREKKPDLVLMDLSLPILSGWEAARQIKSDDATAGIPVIAVTAHAMQGDRERALAAGCDGFVAKPIDENTFASLVASFLPAAGKARAEPPTPRSYDKLLQLDRLKSDFLSTVSHELRTPLNTIILLSHLIEREGRTPADAERRLHDVRVIRDSAETLLRMINNIVDLAKLEAGQRDLHPVPVELAVFLREIARGLEWQAAAKGIRLTLELPPDLPETANLDREKLSRVLINLLTNAVQNTKHGGVALRAASWQGSVAFEVQDTGSGVPAHLVPAVFEPFHQIRTGSGEAPRGTGLGLSISKQLVELMGGDLLFDSREGVGTRVSFTLPLLLDSADPGAVHTRWKSGSMPSGISPSGHPRKVLIVEDDGASRYGLKSLLETEGYEVSEAGDLAQAGQRIAADRPEIVLLDITLPDGDGASWLSSLRERGLVSFPVIALTGVTADEDRRRIERSGVRAVLPKPVNVPLLFETLRECVQSAPR
jgi:signal transduction histidine kinase